MVWAIARAHHLHSHDAADVAQTTWLRLFEHLDRVNEPARVGAWLATTARRECLRVLREGRPADRSGSATTLPTNSLLGACRTKTCYY